MWPIVTDWVAWSVCRSEPCKKWLNRSRCHLGWGLGWAQGTMYYVGCSLMPPSEYHWTVHVRRQCCLLSNYFGHLLLLSYRLVVGFSERCHPWSVNNALSQHWLTWLLLELTCSLLRQPSHALNRSWCCFLRWLHSLQSSCSNAAVDVQCLSFVLHTNTSFVLHTNTVHWHHVTQSLRLQFWWPSSIIGDDVWSSQNQSSWCSYMQSTES